MKLGQFGGMNIVFALFVAVVIAVGSGYIIKQTNLKSKEGAKVSQRGNDQLKLHSFLAKKVSEFRNDISPNHETMKNANNCEEYTDLDDYPDPSGKFRYSCMNQPASPMAHRCVSGVVVTAWIDERKGNKIIKKVFIPDYFAVGHLISSTGSDNTRISSKTSKIADSPYCQDLTGTNDKGKPIYEDDIVTAKEGRTVKIRLLDNTFILLGGTGVANIIKIEKADYKNSTDNRKYDLVLISGIIKVKSSQHSSDSSSKFVVRSNTINILPENETDKDGSEYIVFKGAADATQPVTSVTVLEGAVKIQSVFNDEVVSDDEAILPAGKEAFIGEEHVYGSSDSKVTYHYNSGDISGSYKDYADDINTSWWDDD